MSDNYGNPNETEVSQNLDITRCIEEDQGIDCSAVDFFETHLKELIKWAGINSGEREKIRLVLLGLVSLTENYFRILLSELPKVCPLCHAFCCKVDIKFSSAAYYSGTTISRALIDGAVFSNPSNIADETKKLTGLDVTDSSSVKSALAEFHKVCILRHAAVHSYGRLGGRNAGDLGLGHHINMMVSPSYEALDEICGICQNLVRSYNSFIWKAIVSRLKAKGYLVFDATPHDKQLFASLQNIFWENSKVIADNGRLYESFLETTS
ncbi:hypothetical protein [Xanthomonas sp. CFBP 7912]|uniref:hypothetical protein n=1 Tax=Xanthomonas sp. CFBP 7912 TaxID=1891621 RepID=UPI0011B082AB|nr:hypothetical protein [Xanthomonas sp. CFBP 7912]